MPCRECLSPAFVPVADSGQAGAWDRSQGRGMPVGDVAGSQEPDVHALIGRSHSVDARFQAEVGLLSARPIPPDSVIRRGRPRVRLDRRLP